MSKSEGSVDREISSNCILVELQFTRLSLPQPEIYSRSEFILVKKVSRENNQAPGEGCEEKEQDL